MPDTTNTQIQPAPAQPSPNLIGFGSRDSVRELADRIRLGVPGGRKLEQSEALVLAQIALAHGLDPFTGEIWYIPGTGPMVGIKGLRKAAQKEARKNGGNYWTEFRRISDPEEMDSLNIPAGALAFECRLLDSQSILSYAGSVKALRDAGFSHAEATALTGGRPTTIGYGYLKPGESTKMPAVQCAMKRAEADAIKRRYHIPFSFGDEDTLDGRDTPIDPGPQWNAALAEEELGATQAEIEASVAQSQTKHTAEEHAKLLRGKPTSQDSLI